MDAIKKGIKFELRVQDFSSDGSLPYQNCPVLGIQLVPGRSDGASSKNTGWFTEDNSPSIDRLDPSIGYTKENCKIISWRANRLKSNGNLEEFEKIVSYIKKFLID